MYTPEQGKFEEAWKNAFDGAELTPPKRIWNSIDAKLSQAERVGGGFERPWEKAFQGAELEPSEDVWKAIDVALVQAENVSIKKRVVFYQRLAAASVGVMFMFGTYVWFSGGGSNADLISQKSPAQEELSQAPKATLNSITTNETKRAGKNEPTHELRDDAVSQPNRAGHAKPASDTRSGSVASNQNPTSTNTQALAPAVGGSNGTENTAGSLPVNGNPQSPALASTQSGTQTGIMGLVDDSKTLAGNPPNYSSKNAAPAKNYRYNGGPISTVEPVALARLGNFFGPNDYSIAYRLADAIPAIPIAKKKDLDKENKWASVGFSAGSFYPGVSGSAVTENLKSIRAAQTVQAGNLGFAPASAMPSAARKERIKSGTSMAMAISGGRRLFKKWVLQGGLSYLNQTSTTESQVVSVAQANLLQDGKSGYSLESTNTVTYDERQEINTNFQFVSVPMQIGYVVLDRKVGLQINGGLAPDFLVKNTVYNASTGVETANSASATGNLNAVSVSGMGGLEVSYRFLNHYRLSVVPGLKYSLTPVYDNSLASAKPFVADIGLRFRYIF